MPPKRKSRSQKSSVSSSRRSSRTSTEKSSRSSSASKNKSKLPVRRKPSSKASFTNTSSYSLSKSPSSATQIRRKISFYSKKNLSPVDLSTALSYVIAVCVPFCLFMIFITCYFYATSDHPINYEFNYKGEPSRPVKPLDSW